MEIKYCYVKEEYFAKNSNYQNMLDPGNYEKQSRRLHICIQFEINNLIYLVPLRNNLGKKSDLMVELVI